MGKKQHQKDKMYLTCTEWTTLYGGKKAESGEKRSFKKLPFHCCSLSLQPFEHPMCTPEGAVFDLLSIVPYLKKYRHNPVTGKPMDAKSLIKLNFHKNTDGKYHCPVTFKVFNENSHIVAIRNTGNVYIFEAVDRLNLKPRNLKELLTDEPFTRADIITLQDPTHPERFDVTSFYHVKNSLSASEDDSAQQKDPSFYLRRPNPETRAALEALSKEYKEPEQKKESKSDKEKATSINAAHYSSGAVAAGFTSTVGDIITENDPAILDRDTLLYKLVTKKGYVRIQTSLGDLNFELHCDVVPKACQNFITHSKNGYYNGTVFHRSIKNFMIQGGDPTGTGKGGSSVWGKPFKDEFRPNLTHSGRGVLSMANSGTNTNKSQFFITFRSCRHLDGKHTVFGRLVGGLEVLGEMEAVPTNDEDKPLEEITITNCVVFLDPFEEAEQKLTEKEKRETEQAKEQQSLETKQMSTTAVPTTSKVFREGVGKYIPRVSSGKKRTAQPSSLPSSSGSAAGGGGDEGTPSSTKKPKLTSRGGFGDFSSW